MSWWEGGTSSATCRRVSQLEVCQLLSSGSQVVYSVGLNGCEVPVIASPPKSLAKGANLLGGKPIYLKVDILQSIMEGSELKALPPGSHSSSILIASPIRAPPLKAEGEVSMTTEVRELLSQAVLDTSEHVSGSSTPKRQVLMVLGTPLPTKPEDFPWPVDTSSQVSTQDDAEMEDASLEEIPAASSPTAETPGPSGDAPPLDTAHVQEEVNKALGDLLAIKSFIDTCWQKLVWSLAWPFIKMILKLQSLSRKQRPSAPILSRKQRPIAQQPSGKQRLREPPRLAPFNAHMLKPFSTLKKKLSKRRVRVNSTSSLPVKLPCELAFLNSVAHW